MLSTTPVTTLLTGSRSGLFFSALCVATLMFYFRAERTSLLVPNSAMHMSMVECHGSDSFWVFVSEVIMIQLILTNATWVFLRGQLAEPARPYHR